MKLPAGKVPPHVLKVVFRYLGAKRKEVVVGPSYGLDGAVLRIGDKAVVTSMDPITGALERVGWLALNINANDVATFGVQPIFFSSCLLLPENGTEETVETICRQIDLAAKALGVAVTGGHSETTPRLSFPIVVGSCIGVTEKDRYVTAQKAKAGNMLILTKSLGMEGTAILAADNWHQLAENIDEAVLKKAVALFNNISIVKEALLAYETGWVTAMHDPTECGVAGGIHELAEASDIGFKVYEEKMLVAEETREICKFYQLDPMQLIASGSLLIAVERTRAQNLADTLVENKVPAAVIGELLPSSKKRLIVRTGGRVDSLPRPESDHLWSALREANPPTRL